MNKVAGADVGVGVRSRVVGVEVEEPIVRVRVVVTADVQDAGPGVRVDAKDTSTAPLRRESREIPYPTAVRGRIWTSVAFVVFALLFVLPEL